MAQTPAPQPATPPLSKEQVQEKVYAVLRGSASQIDACTEAYTTEFPGSTGKAQLTAFIQKDGTVLKSEVSTALEGARNLRTCLESVARKWKLPPIHSEQEKLNLTIAVKKGQKFSLLKPGEKKPEQPGQAPQPAEEDGFVGFLPQSYGDGN